MRILAAVILMMTVSGCWRGAGGGVDARPICSGTEVQRTAHAAALAADGGPMSVVTGRALIAAVDAGCGEG
ncbi:hypothetical protein [Roseicitreum antarcticum]|uniref:hypothetical protein n=1 Tax=Roseicitreum antarcticum TaxID=564137 RepID=UPI001CC1FB69|nr:hypothetical protein [Roseicitreum antarcticum]